MNIEQLKGRPLQQNAVPCFKCGAVLNHATGFASDDDPTSRNQPYAGTSFRSYGHYGSTFFDPFAKVYIEIAICDDCLRRNSQNIIASFSPLSEHCDIPEQNQT